MRLILLCAGFLLGSCVSTAHSSNPPPTPAPQPAQSPGAPSTQYSTNAEANDLFARAQDKLAHGDPRTGGSFANAREAIALYEQAAAHDPHLALAYVQIARAWQLMGYSNPDAPPGEEIDRRTREALDRAFEINPDLPEAHQMR